MSKKNPLSRFAPRWSHWLSSIPSDSRVNRWGCPHRDCHFRTVRTPIIAHVSNRALSMPAIAWRPSVHFTSSSCRLARHPRLSWLWKLVRSMLLCRSSLGEDWQHPWPHRLPLRVPLLPGSPGMHRASVWVPSEGSQCGWWERPFLRVNSQAVISEMHPQLCLCQCLRIKPVVELLCRCLRYFRCELNKNRCYKTKLDRVQKPN